MSSFNSGPASSTQGNTVSTYAGTDVVKVPLSAPRNVTINAGNGQVTVGWDAPEFGLPDYYSVTIQPSGRTVQSSGNTAVISGLSTTVACTAYVAAVNAGGQSLAGVSRSVTPQVTPYPIIPSGAPFAWYAADQITPVPSGGANVATWSDFSGNGRNITTTPNPATFLASWTNNKPALTFTGNSGGTGSYMRLPFSMADIGSLFTLYFAVDLTAAVNGGSDNDMRLFSNGAGSAPGTVFEIDTFGNGSTTNTFRQLWPLTNLQSSAISITTPYIFSAVYGINGGGKQYVNGTAQTGVISAQSKSSVLLTLAARFDNTKVFRGRIAEVLIMAGANNDNDRHLIEAYFGSKYNVTMAVQ